MFDVTIHKFIGDFIQFQIFGSGSERKLFFDLTVRFLPEIMLSLTRRAYQRHPLTEILLIVR